MPEILEQAKSTAYAGGQIALWAGGNLVERAAKPTGYALSIAGRGLGMVLERGRQAREAAQVALEGSQLAKNRAFKDYIEKTNVSVGLLETSTSPDVIEAVKKQDAQEALAYATFCKENGVTVELPLAQRLVYQLNEGGMDPGVVRGMMVKVPADAMIESEESLEKFIGTFDPTVPFHRDLQLVEPYPTADALEY